MEGFAASGLNPLRVGFAGRVPAPLHPYTLDARIELHPLKKAIDKIKTEITSYEKRIEALEERDKIRWADQIGESPACHDLCPICPNSDSSWTVIATFTERVKNLSRIKYAKEREMLHDIVSDADVVRSFVSCMISC